MKGNETILITTVLSFTNSLSRTTFILALRQVSFIQTSSVWIKLLQYVVTFKQANLYAYPQARVRGDRNCLKSQSINYFTIAACGNVIEFHSVLLFIDPSRLILMDSVHAWKFLCQFWPSLVSPVSSP